MTYKRKGKLSMSMRYIFTLFNLVAMLTFALPLTAQRTAPTSDRNTPLSKTNFTQQKSTTNNLGAQVCNTASIDYVTSTNTSGPADLYPSPITLSGFTGNITNMSITLNDVEHTWGSDFEILLVGPGGENFVVLADVGSSDGFDTATTLTLTDSAGGPMPTGAVAIPTGSYQPTTNGTVAGFPAPAPGAPYNLPATGGAATFASVYNGTDPNGTWNLYVFDDAGGDTGMLGGGWCIDVDTGVIPASVQLVNTTLETDEAGRSGTSTFTVQRGGDTSAALTVDYATSDGTATGGVACGSGVDYVTSSGTVSWAAGDATDMTISVPVCNDILVDGDEDFNITLSNPVGGVLGTNTAGVSTIIDSATQFKVVSRSEIPGTGTGSGTAPHSPAGVYPQALTVSGLTGMIATMRVTLYGVSHTFPDDMEVLLEGPTGATFVLMADAGGGTDIVDATITFDDASTTILPGATVIASGSYEPANYTTPISDFPIPAPVGPYMEPGTTLTSFGAPTMADVFGGTDPNGAWNLYIRDDAAGDAGGIEGWGIQFAGPTAGEVSISGRAINENGRGIANQTVSVTGGGLASPRTTRTNSFGYFTIRELDAGSTYILSIDSKKYIFNNPTQVVTTAEDVGGIVFSTGKQ